MSVDSPDVQEGRDLEAELEEPEAGERGLPVDARCTQCKHVRAKLVSGRDDPTDTTSFRHICHNCCVVTWWNVIRVLEGGDRDV